MLVLKIGICSDAIYSRERHEHNATFRSEKHYVNAKTQLDRATEEYAQCTHTSSLSSRPMV